MKRLYAFLRTRFGKFIFYWMLRYMTFALPVERLRETATLIAFHHPKPDYPLHVILIPRAPIATLAELNPVNDSAFLTELFSTVQSLVKEFHLAEGGYRLIVNGGKFQEFPHLHFHLISDTVNVPAV
jgi:histidine triad (HIT) family protein